MAYSQNISLQWPDTFCLATTEELSYPDYKHHRDFRIHGFYSEFLKSNPKIKILRGINLDMEKIPEKLKKKMKKHWISMTQSNQNFWNYEWAKHGYNSGFTEKDYFKKAIKIKKKLSFLDDLIDIGTFPGSQLESSVSDLEDIIKEKTGGYCPKVVISGEGNLKEVKICVDATGKNFRDWPKSHKPALDQSTRKYKLPITKKLFETSRKE